MNNIYKSVLVLSLTLLGSVAIADTKDITSGVITVTTESGNEIQLKAKITEFVTSGMQTSSEQSVHSLQGDDIKDAAAISE